LIKSAVIPTEEGWGGWLGAYQRAVRQAAMARDIERFRRKQHSSER
jgi:hypothetical protein